MGATEVVLNGNIDDSELVSSFCLHPLGNKTISLQATLTVTSAFEMDTLFLLFKMVTMNLGHSPVHLKMLLAILS